MVEASAHEVSEAVMAQALVEGHNVIKQIVAVQKELRAQGRQAEAPAREEGRSTRRSWRRSRAR